LAKRFGKSVSAVKQKLSSLPENIKAILHDIDEIDAYEFSIKYAKEFELSADDVGEFSVMIEESLDFIERVL